MDSSCRVQHRARRARLARRVQRARRRQQAATYPPLVRVVCQPRLQASCLAGLGSCLLLCAMTHGVALQTQPGTRRLSTMLHQGLHARSSAKGVASHPAPDAATTTTATAAAAGVAAPCSCSAGGCSVGDCSSSSLRSRTLREEGLGAEARRDKPACVRRCSGPRMGDHHSNRFSHRKLRYPRRRQTQRTVNMTI